MNFILILLIFLILIVSYAKFGSKESLLVKLDPEVYSIDQHFNMAKVRENLSRFSEENSKYLMSGKGSPKSRNEIFLFSLFYGIFKKSGQNMRTDFNIKFTPVKNIKLNELFLFKYDFDVQRMKKCLDELYRKYPKNIITLGKSIKVLASNETHRSTYSSFEDTLNFFRKHCSDPYLFETTKKLIKEISNFCGYKYGMSEINNYSDNLGMPQHFDTMSGKNGPIYTINIGNEFYYDMFPILEENCENGIRLKVPPGGIFSMEKNMRYRWTHGIPDNVPNMVGKYCIEIWRETA